MEEPKNSSANAMTASQLRGIIQIGRGMFSPGLYLTLYPASDDRLAVHIRLEEGRNYLDSEVDVLFSRFGVREQGWTVVGTIGHHGQHREADLNDPTFISDDEVVRSRFGLFVNSFLQGLGHSGFLDLPQEPAFSLIPIGVYRTINSI